MLHLYNLKIKTVFPSCFRCPAFYVFILLCFLNNNAKSQNYTLNGNATQTSCRCYVLTPALNTQVGSVWNNVKINLNTSFTFVFDVGLGCSDNPGADGMAFVLQPISTNVGVSGQGLGFGGVVPSIGVTLDTYQNGNDGDPYYDHIAIQRNGNVDHNNPTFNLAGPIQASASNVNIEDCITHKLTVQWDAVTKTLSTAFDGVPRVSVVNDLVNTTFNGDPLVYWGFTGATGGENNMQTFCTALSPQWSFNAGQNRCVNEPITFNNNTISFAPVAKTYWTFGDDPTYIDSINVSPTHTYTTGGDFTVIQRVRGFDGCEETNPQVISIGTKPIAGFFKNADSCIGTLQSFTDTSFATTGTINTWYWDLDNSGITATTQNTSTTYTTPGYKNIKLSVKSLEGCASDTLIKQIRIKAKPIADFSFTDSLCLGSTFQFQDASTLSDGPVSGWNWQVDGSAANIFTSTLPYTFTTPGNHTVSLLSTGTAGGDCFSPIRTKNVFVADKPHAGLKANSACQNSTITLLDSSYSTDGIVINNWWWDLGNGNTSNLQNPSVSYNTFGIKTIKHVVKNTRGCISDTITYQLTVNQKPLAKYDFVNTSCNNDPVRFSDSSLPAGNIASWAWTENSIVFSTIQNPALVFAPGNHTTGLTVTGVNGCKSDIVYKSFFIQDKPRAQLHLKDTCKQAPAYFSANENGTSTGITDWHWMFGDNTSGQGVTTTHTYSQNGAYTVKLFGFTPEGCTSDTVTKVINIYGTNAFAGNDIKAAAGQPVQLQATGGLSYIWTPGLPLLNNDQIANPIATLSTSQTFTVKAFTPEGCESFDDVKVEIYKGPDIYIPTAFTPNSDRVNDLLRGIPVGIKEFKIMRIYNRWGQLVFETSDPNRGWDGRFKGMDQVPGNYIVIASGIDFTGKLVEKKQSVLLLR